MEYFNNEGWVSQELLDQAKNQGLTICISNSDTELNPLRHSDYIIVGGGGHDAISSVANINIDKPLHGNRIEDAVRNYANEYNINQNDFLWWTIHTHRHSQITLDTRLIKDTYVFEVGIGGFICMDKKLIREEYGVQRISKKLESIIEERARDSLKDLADWINGDVYRITLLNEDDELVDGMDGVYVDKDGRLDSTVIDMLEQCATKSA